MDDNAVKEKLKDLLKEYFGRRSKARSTFVPGKTRIPLNVPSYDWEEVYEATESLITTQVTMGAKVRQFEDLFARYMGVRHAIMVNSGSSANLLAMSILTNPAMKNRIEPGDEVVTPAVTWATTVYPIINCGALPVFVDVSMDDFNMMASELERAITERTKAIMLVHLLGNPCDMDAIMKVAQEHDLFLVEDTCEAHGAEFHGRKTGSFGHLGTFSFFFSHHISTIEGGMVVTSDDTLAELAKALRVFGWVRDLKNKESLAQTHEGIDSRYLFVNTGYNLRPTEIQGAFGMHQIGRLDKFIELRAENARFWTESLRKYSRHLSINEPIEGTKPVWFGYPVTVTPEAPFTRKELMDFLESRGVETRPIMAGNFDEQPVMRMFPYRKVGDLPNAKLIMRNSFFFGNHHGIGNEERQAIAEYIEEFMANKGLGRPEEATRRP